MAQGPKPNPQIVKDEIIEYVREQGLGIYYVEPEMWPNERSVWWDTNKVPDYKKFIEAARSNGAKMILFFDEELDEEAIADAEEALEMASLEPDEFREYARQIGELRSYLGFTSRLGVGFASEGMFYWFDLEAPWYEEMLEMLEDLQLSNFPYPEPTDNDDDEEEPPISSFYSKN